jgi:hypothetical protein
MMASIKVTNKKDEVTPDLKNKLRTLPQKSSDMVDDVSNIFLDALKPDTPVGKTKELLNKTTISIESFLKRYVYSEALHWNFVIPGHRVLGPIFSAKQRRYWFWLLHNVYGGNYKRKTSGKTQENDYPLKSFNRSQPSVENRVNQFLEYLRD